MKSRFFIRLMVLVGFTVLYFLRRPADALYPAVWAEDGLYNIPQGVAHGWLSLWIPVNGYLIVPSKLVTLSSLSISGLFYPEVAYVLTFLATLAVLWGLTSDFIQIRGIVWLPLIIALLPYNPEVFATPLYIFWWTSLLLLLPLLRSLDNRINEPRERLTLVLLLLIGGLSSPLCIILLPLMLLRVSLTRQRFDYVLLMVWATLSLLQLALALWAPKGESAISLGSAINTGALPIFLGNYLLYDGWLAQDNWVTYGLFVALAVLAIYGVIKLIQRKQVTLFYLVCPLVAMFGSITVSLIRVGFAPDPMNAGPRYFFFPYIFFTLFLMAVATYTPQPWVKYGCIGLIAMACTLTWVDNFSRFYRLHDPLSWQQELKQCMQDTTGLNPGLAIHSSGDLATTWQAPLSPYDCRQLADGGILARFFGLNSTKLETW